MAIKSVEVCIVSVRGPRDEDPRIGPSRCTLGLNDHLRRDVRERPGRRLPVAHGDQPLVEERSGVVDVIDDRRDELCVSHPPEPFVALRAIGRDSDGVAANRPQHVFMQQVRRLVGALEASDLTKVAGDHHGSNGLRDGRSRTGMTSDLGVAEAVNRERWLDVLSRAAAHDDVMGARGAQVGGVELLLVDRLGVAKVDASPNRKAGRAESKSSSDVGAEVDDEASVRRCEHVLRRSNLEDPHRRVHGKRQFDVVRPRADR